MPRSCWDWRRPTGSQSTHTTHSGSWAAAELTGRLHRARGQGAGTGWAPSRARLANTPDSTHQKPSPRPPPLVLTTKTVSSQGQRPLGDTITPRGKPLPKIIPNQTLTAFGAPHPAPGVYPGPPADRPRSSLGGGWEPPRMPLYRSQPQTTPDSPAVSQERPAFQAGGQGTVCCTSSKSSKKDLGPWPVWLRG